MSVGDRTELVRLIGQFNENNRASSEEMHAISEEIHATLERIRETRAYIGSVCSQSRVPPRRPELTVIQGGEKDADA